MTISVHSHTDAAQQSLETNPYYHPGTSSFIGITLSIRGYQTSASACLQLICSLYFLRSAHSNWAPGPTISMKWISIVRETATSVHLYRTENGLFRACLPEDMRPSFAAVLIRTCSSHTTYTSREDRFIMCWTVSCPVWLWWHWQSSLFICHQRQESAWVLV